MRKLAVGLVVILVTALGGPAIGDSMTEEIRDDEQPGSEIEVDIGGGKAGVGSQDGQPLLQLDGDGTAVDLDDADDALDVPVDPAFPNEGDAVDDKLPGEGPEDLSGPDDNPLPEQVSD
jgi:hypothetical protein